MGRRPALDRLPPIIANVRRRVDSECRVGLRPDGTATTREAAPVVNDPPLRRVITDFAAPFACTGR